MLVVLGCWSLGVCYYWISMFGLGFLDSCSMLLLDVGYYSGIWIMGLVYSWIRIIGLLDSWIILVLSCLLLVLDYRIIRLLVSYSWMRFIGLLNYVITELGLLVFILDVDSRIILLLDYEYWIWITGFLEYWILLLVELE